MPIPVNRPAEYRLKRIAVAPHTRDFFARSYPGLGNNAAYWRLLGWSLFSGFLDAETGRTVLPAEVLSLCEGKERFDAKNYSASKLLGGFRRDVCALELSQQTFSGWQTKARQIVALGCSNADTAAVLGADTAYTGERVDFVTGEPFNRTRRKAETTQECSWVVENSSAADNEASALIYQYFLGLDGYRETYEAQINRNWRAALATLAEVYLVSDADTEEARAAKLKGFEAQSRALSCIRSQPVPFVRPSARSARLSPVGASWAALKREVYRELTVGWDKLDLRAAQLAIVARLWGVAELETFLAAGGNVWVRLLGDLGLQPTAKAALKEAVYKLVFGARKRTDSADPKERAKTIVLPLDAAFGRGFGDRFLAHPLIAPLVSARARCREEVTAAGGLTDCFGRWLAVSEDQSWRSVLAQEAQAAEQLLMAEVFKVASETEDFFVAVYKYDGVAICWRNRKYRARWLGRLQEAVAAKAAELGIHTALDVEA
ncbi:MAG TPA: hypothetical protein VFS21_25390 [Roseiflexaceae bacterium]|nr:hypothetical protein [Roseiflexaceae bacterium]